MHFHHSIFDDLAPTARQAEAIAQLRAAARLYLETSDRLIPDGADKVMILRRLRDAFLWSLEAIKRHADGSPRTLENP